VGKKIKRVVRKIKRVVRQFIEPKEIIKRALKEP
jgi:hypothetical protein